MTLIGATEVDNLEAILAWSNILDEQVVWPCDGQPGLVWPGRVDQWPARPTPLKRLRRGHTNTP